VCGIPRDLTGDQQASVIQSEPQGTSGDQLDQELFRTTGEIGRGNKCKHPLKVLEDCEQYLRASNRLW